MGFYGHSGSYEQKFRLAILFHNIPWHPSLSVEEGFEDIRHNITSAGKDRKAAGDGRIWTQEADDAAISA